MTTTLFYTSIIATSHTSKEDTDTRTNMRAQRHYGKHTNAKVDDFLESESHRPIYLKPTTRYKKSFIFACEGPNELYLYIDISKHLQFMIKSKNN